MSSERPVVRDAAVAHDKKSLGDPNYRYKESELWKYHSKYLNDVSSPRPSRQGIDRLKTDNRSSPDLSLRQRINSLQALYQKSPAALELMEIMEYMRATRKEIEKGKTYRNEKAAIRTLVDDKGFEKVSRSPVKVGTAWDLLMLRVKDSDNESKQKDEAKLTVVQTQHTVYAEKARSAPSTKNAMVDDQQEVKLSRMPPHRNSSDGYFAEDDTDITDTDDSSSTDRTWSLSSVTRALESPGPTNSAILTKYQRVVNTLMSDFHSLINSGNSVSRSRDGGTGSSTKSSETSGPSGSGGSPDPDGRSPTSKGRKRSRNGNGDGSNKDQDDEPPKIQRIHSPSPSATAKRFACPYFRRSPSYYLKYRSCLGPGWTTVHRVKEHVYRRHSALIRCARCGEVFEADSNLEDHYRLPQRCEVRINVLEPEGVTKEQEKALRKRKKLISEEEWWRDMYRILFPNAAGDNENEGGIPSPRLVAKCVECRRRTKRGSERCERCVEWSGVLPSSPHCRLCRRSKFLIKSKGLCNNCNNRALKEEREGVKKPDSRKCVDCGEVEPKLFRLGGGGKCNPCYERTRKEKDQQSKKTRLTEQVKVTETRSSNDLDKEVLQKWSESWDKKAPPGYKELSLKVRLRPPELNLAREAARDLYAERARVGMFYRILSKFRIPETIKNCHCGLPEFAGHYAKCVFTRHVASEGALKSWHKWREIWETKRKKVEILWNLEKQGHWFEIDAIGGRILVDKKVISDGSGVDTQRVQENPTVLSGDID